MACSVFGRVNSVTLSPLQEGWKKEPKSIFTTV